MSNEKFKVKFGLAVGDTAATIDGTSGDIVTAGNAAINGGSITTTQTTANIVNTTATTVNIAGAGTTVSIGANTGTTTVNNSLVADDISVLTVDTTNLEVTNIKAKDGTAAATIADSTGVITISTELNVDNIKLSGGTISTTNTNGDLVIEPNGLGDIYLTSDNIVIGDLNTNVSVTTKGTGNLSFTTSGGTNSGLITMTQGVDGAITLSPNGAGDIVLTLANGGNLTNSRNYVFGAIRNSTTEAAGDISALTTQGFRGISLDNSADTTKGPWYLGRSYSGGATANQLTRARVLFEKSRGTALSPAAVQTGDFLGSVDATGYSATTGWLSDAVQGTPSFFGFTATENWSGLTNVGTGFTLALQPTATTLTGGGASTVQVLQINPQTFNNRSDSFTWAGGKSATLFTATGSSISGTTLTIGTVTSGTVQVGQFITTAISSIAHGTYIVSNISGSGSGSTWVVSQSQSISSTTISGTSGEMYLNSTGNLAIMGDLRVNGNNILSSGNTNALTLAPVTGFNSNTFLDGNLVKGIIRDTTTENNGDVWSLTSGAAAGTRGISVDNSVTPSKRPGIITRAYSATTGTAPRSMAVTEIARGNPTSGLGAVQTTDRFCEMTGQGYNGTNWTGDVVANNPFTFRAEATETWSDSPRRAGTKFLVFCQPAGVDYTTTSVTNIINHNPLSALYQADVWNFETRTTASGGTQKNLLSLTPSASSVSADTFTFKDSSVVTKLVGNKIDYNRVYGQWQYDATITPAAANTAYAFQFQGGSAVTDYANIASATNTSRIQPNATGFYNLQFSIQLENTDNAADHTAYIWWRKNGVDIPSSMGRVYVTKQHQTISAWNNLVEATASTDYFELMYAVDDVQLIFPYFATTAFGPATAAAFLTITPVGA